MKNVKIISGIVVVLLVVSVILNLSLLSKLKNVEYQLSDLEFSQQININRVNDQISYIQSAMDNIRQENSWISEINVDFDTDINESKDTLATFEWKIEELRKEAEVNFNYAFGANEEYASIPAEQVNDGVFHVTIPIEVHVEPLWEVSIFDERTNEFNQPKHKKDDYDQDFLYFVSMTNDDVVKSSEIHTDNLSYIGTSQYGVIETQVNLFEEEFNVTIQSYDAGESPFRIEEVYLLKYEDNSVVDEQKLDPEADNHTVGHPYAFFNSTQIKRSENMNLTIKVVYSNGDTFEEEVY
ncbi:hypothetical protein NC661_11710 [Aquibacillus koreensis]|uniref:Uncharacterized protein n=1 Tax=Aquibacillus koreensis TaxID=279446 RepID=A0A9X3WJR3_9BACI|nr:hypothetical protein [Aquibacillus koreensis]MCT2535178.1 hypothetical protein [Aquibacillus koreensis]MDC3421037.1 hypothetical protein [Aquibacillus koreensis]